MAYIAILDGEQVPVTIGKGDEGKTLITIGEKLYTVDPRWTRSDLLSLIIDGRSYQVDIHSEKDLHEVLIEGEHFEFELFDERKALLKKSAVLGAEGVQEIKSSMPGKIVKVLVSEEEEVEQGQGLVVMEAMKMENEIKSPKAGIVKKIGVTEGQAVESGALLVVVE
ncbi:MAG: acetyl-CoA carboxylase biotin carboxyl carrier protein subunit [bacterium]|nr:acetyl-CoA carboxylase biotin carboxyl carrier protein subunit [bacterium]MDT8396511.1 biotin/lipoyl-containing protein [bacterium]